MPSWLENRKANLYGAKIGDIYGADYMEIRNNGTIKPVSLADTEAVNNSIYYSTTQSKLVYKDGSGVVNDLY